MEKLFNKTYFKFLFGFLAIIAVSVIILLVIGYMDSGEAIEGDINNVAEIVE